MLPPQAEPNTARLPDPAATLAAVQRVSDPSVERDGLVHLDRNERLAALPEPLLSEIRDALTSELLTGYPVTEPLYEDLARFLGVARERLLLTTGSDAAMKALFQVYARPGDRAVMLDPSYAMYPVYAEIFGAEAVRVPFAADLSLDADALLAAIEPGVRLVFLANPNQPTGTLLTQDLLRAALRRAGEVGALVVVDEAYHPFSGTTVLPWLDEHRNLVVTRTFSKAWGLAGLRVGFAAAALEVIANLAKVRSVYDVNAVAALCARTLLAHPEVADDYVAAVDAGRELLAGRLEALRLEPVPGRTNFQVVRLAGRAEAAPLVAALRDRGFLVKGPFAAPCLADCIRVTLGPPELMNRFADALTEVLDGNR